MGNIKGKKSLNIAQPNEQCLEKISLHDKNRKKEKKNKTEEIS